jgi:FkbM family methyltransferase
MGSSPTNRRGERGELVTHVGPRTDVTSRLYALGRRWATGGRRAIKNLVSRSTATVSERVEGHLTRVRGPAGRTLYVETTDERGAELVRAHGDHNPGALRMWRKLVASHEWEIIVDVGANYGEMLVNVDLPERAITYALEPNPAAAACLARTLFESEQQIELLVVAASDSTGLSTFLADLEWSGKSGIESKTAGSNTQPMRVATIRLDDLVVGTPLGLSRLPDVLVKIDVEGHEERVLAGLSGTARSGGALTCMVEITHMSGSTLASLNKDYAIYLHNPDADAFVRVAVDPHDNPTELASSLGAYPHDAVLVAKGGRDLLARTATRPSTR